MENPKSTECLAHHEDFFYNLMLNVLKLPLGTDSMIDIRNLMCACSDKMPAETFYKDSLGGSFLPILTSEVKCEMNALDAAPPFALSEHRVAIGTWQKEAAWTNVYAVQTVCKCGTTVLSYRYGTPVRRSRDLNDILKTRKTKGEPSRMIILSLLDVCGKDIMQSVGSISGSSKFKEHPIVRDEDLTYSKRPDIQFLNMSVSKALNNTFRTKMAAIGLSRFDFTNFDEWVKDLPQMRALWACLKSTAFGGTGKATRNTASERMMQLIAISVMHFAFSKEDSGHSYAFYYHCKSGKDRTGLVFAVDQTVIHYCSAALRAGKSLIDAWYELTTKLQEGCDTDGFSVSIKLTMRPFLFRSWLITYASTGVAGLKWNIKSDGDLKESEDNPVALLLDTRQQVRKWCGASKRAKS